MQDSQGSPEQPKSKVKCKDCGFLAFRRKESMELVAVDPSFRENPDMAARGRHAHYSSVPVCFVAESDIEDELSGCKIISTKSVGEVISKERECGGYTSVIHGLSPREHLQMQLLEEQRKREDVRDNAVKKREDDRDRAQARANMWNTLIGATIAAFGLPLWLWMMNSLYRPAHPSNETPRTATAAQETPAATSSSEVPAAIPKSPTTPQPHLPQPPVTTAQPPAKPTE